MRLHLATGNAHKVAELTAIVARAGLPVQVASADEAGGMPPVVEDADTFAGNALLKAKALAERLPEDGWALADDSGLCVDFLDGAPGVYSSRYAGEDASDADNVRKLLQALDGVADRDRGAAFVCVLALVSGGGEEILFEGRCAGRIVGRPRGESGFGYDPVFAPEGRERTFAEMSGAEKAALSHRGKAVERLLAWLRTNAA